LGQKDFAVFEFSRSSSGALWAGKEFFQTFFKSCEIIEKFFEKSIQKTENCQTHFLDLLATDPLFLHYQYNTFLSVCLPAFLPTWRNHPQM